MNRGELGEPTRTLVRAIRRPCAAQRLRHHRHRARLAARRQVEQHEPPRQACQRQRAAALRRAAQPHIVHARVRHGKAAAAAQLQRRDCKPAVNLHCKQPWRRRRKGGAACHQRAAQQVAAAEVLQAKGLVQRVRGRRRCTVPRQLRGARRGRDAAAGAQARRAHALLLLQPLQLPPRLGQLRASLRSGGVRLGRSVLGRRRGGAVYHNDGARGGEQADLFAGHQPRFAVGAAGRVALRQHPLPHAPLPKHVPAAQRHRHVLAGAAERVVADVALRRGLAGRALATAEQRGAWRVRRGRRGRATGAGLLRRLRVVQNLNDLSRRRGQQLKAAVAVAVRRLRVVGGSRQRGLRVDLLLGAGVDRRSVGRCVRGVWRCGSCGSAFRRCSDLTRGR